MAFATGEDVMRTVEQIIADLPEWLNTKFGMLRIKDRGISPVSLDKMVIQNNIFLSLPIPHSGII
jgi:hypothetical protein